MRRRDFIALFGGTAAAATRTVVAPAQQRSLPVGGFISSLSAAALTDPIAASRQGLGSEGYEEEETSPLNFDGRRDTTTCCTPFSQQQNWWKQQVAVIVTVGGDPLRRLQLKLPQRRFRLYLWSGRTRSN